MVDSFTSTLEHGVQGGECVHVPSRISSACDPWALERLTQTSRLLADSVWVAFEISHKVLVECEL